MKRFWCPLAFTVLLIGCAKEPTAEKQEFATRSYLISMDSLQKVASALPLSFSDDPVTRSESKQIYEILPITDFLPASTRSGESDVCDNVYVVNYDNDAGFAILSTDTRTDQILAYSDNGNLTEAESHPGVHFFIEGIPAFIEEQIASYSAAQDSLDDNYYYESWTTATNTSITTKGPYTKTTWNQNPDPYNSYFPYMPCVTTSGNSKAFAGCVTIAVVQIIAYYNKPVSFTYGGQSLSISYWPDYTTTHFAGFLAAPQKELLGKYIYYMTEHARLNATYDCTKTSIGMTDARTHLKSVGLQISGNVNYQWAPTKQDIDNQRIVLLDGNSSTGGHAWIIDGYRIKTTQYTWVERCYDQYGNFIRETTGTFSSSQNLVRCNWGWGGLNDGYFNSGVFNANNPPVETRNTGTIDRNYNRNLQMVNNIR